MLQTKLADRGPHRQGDQHAVDTKGCKHSPLVRSVLFSGYGVTVGDSGGVSVMAVAARM
jgi:hypothetical protein